MNKRQRKKVINKRIYEKHPRLYYSIKEFYMRYGKSHRTREKAAHKYYEHCNKQLHDNLADMRSEQLIKRLNDFLLYDKLNKKIKD